MVHPDQGRGGSRPAAPLLQSTQGSGSKGEGHAEAAAAGLRNDPDGQQKILGGHMEDVNSAVSSVAICSVECSDDMNTSST